MKTGADESSLTRKSFLYALGTLAGAAIGGWILTAEDGEHDLSKRANRSPDEFPRLRSDVILEPTEFGAEIYQGSVGVRRGPVCAVNRIGLRVIESLDGLKSVAEIAQRLLVELGAPRSDVEAYESAVALFLAEIGSIGLLRSPFFVNIESCEVSESA